MLFAKLARDFADVLRARDLQLRLNLVSQLDLNDENLVLVEACTLQAALAARGRLAATAYIHCIYGWLAIKIGVNALVLVGGRRLMGCRVLCCCRLLHQRNVM